MAYATAALAIERDGTLRLLVSDRGKDGQIDQTAVARALDDASSVIDSYLGARYDVPIAPVPDVLIRCEIDIAVYLLAHSRPGLSNPIKERYEKCIAWLKDVVAGKASLGLDDPPVSTGGRARRAGPARVLTRDTLSGLY